MTSSEPNTGSLVLGGVLLGIWIFWALAVGGDTTWVFGGLVGFGLAGGIYAGRMASPEARTPIYVAIGLLVGFVMMGIAVTGDVLAAMPGILAFLLTTLGATSIINGLPQRAPEPDGAAVES